MYKIFPEFSGRNDISSSGLKKHGCAREKFFQAIKILKSSARSSPRVLSSGASRCPAIIPGDYFSNNHFKKVENMIY